MGIFLAGKKFPGLLTCVLLALGTLPVAAQDTEGLGTIVAPLEPKRGVGLPDQAPVGAESAPAVPRAASPNAAKDTNQATNAQAAVPAIMESVFSDWTMECLTTGGAAMPCQVVHRALSPDKQQVVMVLSMATEAKTKETKIQMALPLGFAVQAGVGIDLGEGYSGVVQVSRCTTQGCLVDGVAAPEMTAAMETGKSGAISIKTVEGNTISLPLSLSGFDAAFSEMKKKNAVGPS